MSNSLRLTKFPLASNTALESGGQKRRVSLAAALVHSPPLLILDEPTVGVDPLLRQNIWRHLVAMTRHERISVIITTHYIEEARLAHVAGLMRNGRILAEASPEELMEEHRLATLEEVFLKLCMSDSSRVQQRATSSKRLDRAAAHGVGLRASDTFGRPQKQRRRRRQRDSPSGKETSGSPARATTTVRIHTGTNRIELGPARGGSGELQRAGQLHAYSNEAVEEFSSEHEQDDDDDEPSSLMTLSEAEQELAEEEHEQELRRRRQQARHLAADDLSLVSGAPSASLLSAEHDQVSYLAAQQAHWAARRTNALSLARFQTSARLRGPYNGLDGSARGRRRPLAAITTKAQSGGVGQWCSTLLAVTWKNYIRLRRNPPVLIFQFMLPAIQVILFCLCIGGEPFDVPVAVVNEEQVPKSSLAFLGGLSKKIIRQVRYDNLSSAMEAVRRGHVWGALHIPNKYSENLQSRLIMGDEVTNETISNGTIRVYPDLTSE